MGWNNYTTDAMKQARISTMKGNYQKLGEFLCPNGNPLNFIISGRTQKNQFDVLSVLLETIIGRYPIIVIHNNHQMLTQKVLDAWMQKIHTEEEAKKTPVWNLGQEGMVFEPFYGMNSTQVVMILRRLAKQLGYTATPRFERIVRAHIQILQSREMPICLSGLYYLCKFDDMREFQQNIMALPCGQEQARRIWADFGLDNEQNIEQFDLFRNVIKSFVYEMQQSSWVSSGSACRVNCLSAIRNNALLIYPINDTYSELFFSYLVDELRGNAGRPFFLLLDDVKLSDEYFSEFLIHPGGNCRIGIIGENVVGLMGKNADTFSQLSEKINSFILFKHKTAAASRRFSDLIGNFDYTKAEYSEGSQREAFKVLSSGHHTDTRYSIENRYRVMPEDIMGLMAEQAFVFNTMDDSIVKFN